MKAATASDRRARATVDLLDSGVARLGHGHGVRGCATRQAAPCTPVPSDGDLRARACASPSPTGYLHVGNARAALFNWLEARRTGGEMLLRVEDTDRERSSSELVENILASLRWLGLEWDGDIVFQADNLEAHREAALSLLGAGRAYWCDCTAEQIRHTPRSAAARPATTASAATAGSSRATPPRCASACPTTAPQASPTWCGRGQLREQVDRGLRAPAVTGMPMFLLSNAYDDAEMGITHVVRGEDHVPGTPKYLLLRDALGLGRPEVFAHLPMLVNEGRKKLSKRKDAVSVADFAAQGYLPEAMVNYLALLGWGPKRRRRDPPARGDRRAVPARGRHAVAGLLRRQEAPAHQRRVRPGFTVDEFLRRAAPVPHPWRVRRRSAHADGRAGAERVRLLTEVEPMIAFLLATSRRATRSPGRRRWSRARRRPRCWPRPSPSSRPGPTGRLRPIRAAIEAAAVTAGLVNDEGHAQLSKAQGPVRVATTGRSVGPPLFESLEALGRERTLARLRAAPGAAGLR